MCKDFWENKGNIYLILSLQLFSILYVYTFLLYKNVNKDSNNELAL